MLYWASDLHFDHANIIKYCNRPCSVEGQSDWLLQKFEHLQEGDTLYLLGDISCDFRVKLQFFIDLFTHFKNKGVQLYIALGNHDEKFERMIRQAYSQVFSVRNTYDFVNHYFCIRNIQVTPTIKTRITMSHYPLGSWDQSHRGSINLFGHCHGTYRDRKYFQYDVGIDVEHKVFSLDDIIEKYKKDLDEKSSKVQSSSSY